MEAIFENKCVYSKQNLMEMNSKKSPMQILMIFFSILYFINCIYTIITSNDLSSGLTYLVFSVILTILVITPTYANINITLKRNIELYGTEVETVVSFYEDNLISKNLQSKGETVTAYNKLVKIKETKHLYFLYLKHRLVILVDKNGFTKGTQEEFKKFIKEKAVNAKIKIK